MNIRKSAALGLTLLLCVSLLAEFFPAQAAEQAQIPEDGISPWARDGVLTAYEMGLVARSFDLGEDFTRPVTRLQLARLAVDFVTEEQKQNAGSLGEPIDTLPADSEDGDFLDTKSPYAAFAKKLNIMEGAEGLFRPNDKITRAEAAAILQRCMSALEVTEANRPPMVFSDTYDIPRWAVEAVKFVSGREDSTGVALMGGAEGRFLPAGDFTIEQAILTLLRMHDSKPLTEASPGWREAPGYSQVQVSLTFGGDCTFGRGKDFSYAGSFDEMYDQMGPSYFFSGIDEFFNDDLTMVNFEGTLTHATRAASKTFVFKGRPEYAEILPAGSIDVVTIANNHSMDYLQNGFADTIENLTPHVAVSGYEQLPIVTVKGVRIGFASNVGWGFDESQKRFIRESLESLKAAGADLVVFNYHWGIERAYRSNATQRAIARYCVDLGADLVIGHHPHVVQETETYKGKQIAYSLGNLVFGGNHNPSDKNCMIFRQTFTLDLDSREVVSEIHEAIPYQVSSVSRRNDYHPVRAS